ncbi:hypothetical protein LPJ70_005458, partial [Coemansia sp. RSA 2708]
MGLFGSSKKDKKGKESESAGNASTPVYGRRHGDATDGDAMPSEPRFRGHADDEPA